MTWLEHFIHWTVTVTIPLLIGGAVILIAYRFARKHIMKHATIGSPPWCDWCDMYTDDPRHSLTEHTAATEPRDRCPTCGCPVGGFRLVTEFHQDGTTTRHKRYYREDDTSQEPPW